MSNNIPAFLSKVIEAGYQLSPEAFNFLLGIPNETAEKLIEKAIIKASTETDFNFIFNQKYLFSLIETPKPIQLPVKYEKIPAKNSLLSIKIHEEVESEPASNVEGFVKYFQSRYEQLEGILKRRVDLKDAISISSSLKQPLKTKLKTIGIVTEKRMRGPRLFIEIEDKDSSISVMASDDQSVRKGLEIQEDQVIGVDAMKYTEDLLVANDFIWPDVPTNQPNRAEENICAAFLADIHIGSKYFRQDLFEKFIKWINLKLGPIQSKELASRVKYIVIAGDLVDGIGIYPEQLDELNIVDIYEQYNVAAELLSLLPKYIDIIIIPGNHDAVRHSLPQPPIPKHYAEKLYLDERIRMLGSPTEINLGGVEILVEHGKSLDDILSSTPGYDFHEPIKAMELLFRCRHIAPRYGQSTPIAPESVDRLVIKNIPDVMVMGHVHINQTRKYKGVTLISAGAWQEQTPFQKRMNLTPTTGIASILDLQTHQCINLDFNNFE
ncbi:DNA-directed DNA polymerase II small subunit [Candidatus Bathyarchaeota archaeon]|nr:DNA-directed DNA polymerase II small subunit [Candidatus Bathyarchaeota archaeon]